jgi:cyclic pyranopterin phosphate synthase
VGDRDIVRAESDWWSEEEVGRAVTDRFDTRFTHLDARGRAVMVDVTAIASGRVVGLSDAPGFVAADPELLTEARIAGLRGAKATSTLIPLCHPLPLEAIAIDFHIGPHAIEIVATAETIGQTGVEMEALCACAIASLSVLGRVQRHHRAASIEALGLEEKRGGRSGLWQRRPDSVGNDGGE